MKSGFKKSFPDIIERSRWKDTRTMYDSSPGEPFGMFTFKTGGIRYRVMVSDGMGWDHVSVSIEDCPRCPTWDEMKMIKDAFFESECCVVQFHPPQSQYVNNHSYVLHMWHKHGSVTELPPREMI